MYSLLFFIYITIIICKLFVPYTCMTIKIYRYTPSILGLPTRESSESAILIFGRVLAGAGSSLNEVTDDFGAAINSKLIGKKRDISVK